MKGKPRRRSVGHGRRPGRLKDRQQSPRPRVGWGGRANARERHHTVSAALDPPLSRCHRVSHFGTDKTCGFFSFDSRSVVIISCPSYFRGTDRGQTTNVSLPLLLVLEHICRRKEIGKEGSDGRPVRICVWLAVCPSVSLPDCHSLPSPVGTEE